MKTNRLISLALAILITASFVSDLAYADEDFYSANNILFYSSQDVDPNTCQQDSLTSQGSDYAGREIITQAQRKAIAKHQPVYEQAALSSGVPWQMIAVLHLRESGLRLENPSNKQGIYQEYAARNSNKYPPGSVTEEEFLEQSIWAGNFIKGKVPTEDRDALRTGDVEVVKDAFFGYNGRASKYTDQAKSLGFDKGYEGSPYVMNKADAKRDPDALPSGDKTWGQIKSDGGGLVYPANKDHGAFVVYASIANMSSADCSGVGGPTAQKVVHFAKQEFDLWDSKSLTGNGSDYKKYTNDGEGNWCAWFVSWVYNQAGYSLSTSAKNGAVPAVQTIKEIGMKGDRFEYHAKGSYTPKPGDIVVQQERGSHVHIVTAIDGDTITTIGGNQGWGSGGGQASSYRNSQVTEYSYDFKTSDRITGFVSPRN